MSDQPRATQAGSPPVVGLVAALEAGQAHLNDLKRVAAEFDNFRKRVARDQQTQEARANGRVVSILLPIIDDLDLALRAVENGGDLEALAAGVKLVREKFTDALGQLGVERIDAHGAAFDPTLHDAVMDDGGDGDETFVSEELRPGYRLAEHVIRPSMVKVARR